MIIRAHGNKGEARLSPLIEAVFQASSNNKIAITCILDACYGGIYTRYHNLLGMNDIMITETSATASNSVNLWKPQALIDYLNAFGTQDLQQAFLYFYKAVGRDDCCVAKYFGQGFLKEYYLSGDHELSEGSYEYHYSQEVFLEDFANVSESLIAGWINKVYDICSIFIG